MKNQHQIADASKSKSKNREHHRKAQPNLTPTIQRHRHKKYNTDSRPKRAPARTRSARQPPATAKTQTHSPHAVRRQNLDGVNPDSASKWPNTTSP
ncbi:hypothetical protein [Paraburkholderia sp. C35]|uniref:hypothetical protein n=1 Tax=Paraburkholderia sp. C35 TaxID=2126993 RepID=UPI0013A59B9F|nr:hypothetical protein [Paraburkholderia sp. C35]